MKRIISLLLSVALVAALLTACSKPDTLENDTLKYTVDTHYSNMSETVVSYYERLCDAVINGEEEVKLNTMMLDDINQLYYTSFPLFVLVKDIKLSDDGSGLKLVYANESEEHIALVKAFKDKINSIKQECGYGKVSTDKYIFNVYTYITANYSIDNTYLNAYDTLTNSKGYSAAINALFEYLVLQGGGSACHVRESNGTNIISLVKFKNVWYYFDPAGEISDNGGKALKRFAFKADTAYLYMNGDSIEEKGDDAFIDLKSSAAFTVDGNSVKAELKDGKVFEFILN